MAETYREPARDLLVHDRAEVVVLGGGPAGVAAAVAAARAGVETLLIERYGCLGGLATGGLVILLLSYGKRGERLPSGYVNEVYDDLLAKDAARVRPTDRQEIPVYDPETLKCLSLDHVVGAGARLQFHAWGAGAAVSGDRIQALFIESKAGRLAIEGDVFVDCSGDADLAHWAGVPYETSLSPLGLGLPWRFSRVDFLRFQEFRDADPDGWKAIRDMMSDAEVQTNPGVCWRDDEALFLNYWPGDALDIGDLTRCEIELRQKMVRTLDFYRERVPGFEEATFLDCATQVGTRESRRIIPQRWITKDDTPGGQFEDSIGIGVTWTGPQSGEAFEIPYGCLVPQKITNLLCAGRCIGADHGAHQQTRVIGNCYITGQAAGVAAALAVRQKKSAVDLDIAGLQAALAAQGVAAHRRVAT